MNNKLKQLKIIKFRRDLVENAELDWDEDYYMSLNNETFEFVVSKLSTLKKELALAEANRIMRIPPLFSESEVNALEALRRKFAECKRSNETP